jgi:hypothetical protein
LNFRTLPTSLTTTGLLYLSFGCSKNLGIHLFTTPNQALEDKSHLQAWDVVLRHLVARGAQADQVTISSHHGSKEKAAN